MIRILILNLPGLVLKSGSRWYNVTKRDKANLRYFPYPWFMGYATSLLKKNGFQTVLKDAVAEESSIEDVLEFVCGYEPTHVICEPTWASVKEDRKLIDLLDPSIIKIAVGNYATNFPYQCLEQTAVNYVAVGEYEFSLIEFFKSCGKSLPANFINYIKQDYSMPELVKDLDLFPFPERDDVPFENYNEPSCYGKNIVMVSSRGCRLKCSYCNVECIYGRHVYRTRSAKSVVDEMEFLFNEYDFDEIYFDDDNMVSSKTHIDGICKEIIRRDAKVKWLCMGDGLVDDETLELLAKSGCTTYKYGLEHLDPEVLKAIPKPLKSKRLIEIIQKCRSLGMKSYVNLIFGLPKSTFEKDLKMIQEVISVSPDLIQIAIATPYPGTVFFNKAKENGWLVSEDPGFFDASGTSAVSYPDYPGEKIVEMFHLGWQLWYRHVFFRQQKTLLFFVRSEIRRNGLMATAKKILFYALKMLDKPKQCET
jgi:radical SAM superfamily enzyme YgiQ (UPF0313 family)